MDTTEDTYVSVSRFGPAGFRPDRMLSGSHRIRNIVVFRRGLTTSP